MNGCDLLVTAVELADNTAGFVQSIFAFGECAAKSFRTDLPLYGELGVAPVLVAQNASISPVEADFDEVFSSLNKLDV